MLFAAVLRLSEPGEEEPSGRFFAPEGIGMVANPAAELGFCVPRMTPPLATVMAPEACTMALLPALLPPYAPRLDWYESTSAFELTVTLPLLAMMASLRAKHGALTAGSAGGTARVDTMVCSVGCTAS